MLGGVVVVLPKVHLFFQDLVRIGWHLRRHPTHNTHLLAIAHPAIVERSHGSFFVDGQPILLAGGHSIDEITVGHLWVEPDDSFDVPVRDVLADCGGNVL